MIPRPASISNLNQQASVVIPNNRQPTPLPYDGCGHYCSLPLHSAWIAVGGAFVVENGGIFPSLPRELIVRKACIDELHPVRCFFVEVRSIVVLTPPVVEAAKLLVTTSRSIHGLRRNRVAWIAAGDLGAYRSTAGVDFVVVHVTLDSALVRFRRFRRIPPIAEGEGSAALPEALIVEKQRAVFIVVRSISVHRPSPRMSTMGGVDGIVEAGEFVDRGQRQRRLRVVPILVTVLLSTTPVGRRERL